MKDETIEKLRADVERYQNLPEHERDPKEYRRLIRLLEKENERLERENRFLRRQREEEARIASPEACKARVQEKKEHYGRSRVGGFFLLDGWLFHDMVQQRPLCDPWLLRAVLGSLRRDSRPFYKNSENQWVPREDFRNNGRQLDGRQYSFLTTKQLSSWLRQRSGYDSVPLAISDLSDASSPLHAIVSHSDEGFFHLKPVYAGVLVSHYLWDTETLSPEEKDVILQIAWWFNSRRYLTDPDYGNHRLPWNDWSERNWQRRFVVVDFSQEWGLFDWSYSSKAVLKKALAFLNLFVSIEQNRDDRSLLIECNPKRPNNQIYHMFLHATKS